MATAKVGITERFDPAFSNEWIKGATACDFTIVISKGMPLPEGMQYMLDNSNKVIFHATVTGWGGDGFMEPGVKPYQEQLEAVDNFVRQGFPRDHVIIRIDPIWPTTDGVQKAVSVLKAARSLGFKKFRYSYLDIYKMGFAFFAKAGRKQMITDMINDPVGTIKAIKSWNHACSTAEKDGCEFYSCAEGCAPEHHRCGCVSEKDYVLCGIDISRIEAKKTKQRATCLCKGNKTELFPDFKGGCGHKCAYCFWPHSTMDYETAIEWNSLTKKVASWNRIFNSSDKDTTVCSGRCETCNGCDNKNKEDDIMKNFEVTEFRGNFWFLSNMFPTFVTVPWGTFTCAEAAFQAAKCANKEQVEMFKGIKGVEARKLGKSSSITLRSDWDAVKLDIMRQVVAAKFSNPTLAKKLVAIKGDICEGNNWRDDFWGMVYKDGKLVGENNLGKILVEVRNAIVEQTKNVKNDGVQTKGEITMKKEVMIIVPPANMHEAIAAASSQGVSADQFALSTFNYKFDAKAAGVNVDIKAATVPVIGALAADHNKISGVDIKREEGRKLFTFDTFKRLQKWYAAKVAVLPDSVINTVNGKYLFCLSYQEEGLTARFKAAGFEVSYAADDNGKPILGNAYFANLHARIMAKPVPQVVTPAAPVSAPVQKKEAPVNSNKFTVAADVTEIGVGVYRRYNGTVIDERREGNQVSAIVLGNKNANVDINDLWFEAHGVFVSGNTINTKVYAFVRANTRDEAQRYLDAVAARTVTKGTVFSFDSSKIQNGFVRYVCLQPIAKTQRAISILKEALRTSGGNFLYADETVAPVVVKEENKPEVSGADITAVNAVIADIMARVEAQDKIIAELTKKVEEQQKMIDSLVAAKDAPVVTADIKAAATSDIKVETVVEDSTVNNTVADINYDDDDDEEVLQDDLGSIDLSNVDTNISSKVAIPGEDKADITDEVSGADITDDEEDEVNPFADGGEFDFDGESVDDIISDISSESAVEVAAPVVATPVVAVDNDTEETVTKFLSVAPVNRKSYVMEEEYKEDVARRDAKINTAVEAAAVLGVDITAMPKMIWRFLAGKNGGTLDDIKVENNNVFIRITRTGAWQQVTVNEKGRIAVVG